MCDEKVSKCKYPKYPKISFEEYEKSYPDKGSTSYYGNQYIKYYDEFKGYIKENIRIMESVDAEEGFEKLKQLYLNYTSIMNGTLRSMGTKINEIFEAIESSLGLDYCADFLSYGDGFPTEYLNKLYLHSGKLSKIIEDEKERAEIDSRATYRSPWSK